jgi:hypothetical protein
LKRIEEREVKWHHNLQPFWTLASGTSPLIP